jgi:hypothetical protein
MAEGAPSRLLGSIDRECGRCSSACVRCPDAGPFGVHELSRSTGAGARRGLCGGALSWPTVAQERRWREPFPGQALPGRAGVCAEDAQLEPGAALADVEFGVAVDKRLVSEAAHGCRGVPWGCGDLLDRLPVGCLQLDAGGDITGVPRTVTRPDNRAWPQWLPAGRVELGLGQETAGRRVLQRESRSRRSRRRRAGLRSSHEFSRRGAGQVGEPRADRAAVEAHVVAVHGQCRASLPA